MEWILIVIELWVLCGIAAAGFAFAFWQGKFELIAESNRREDLGYALMFGLTFGPLALLISFFAGGFGKYGWRLWPKARSTKP